MEMLANMRNEAASGTFHTACYGDVSIGNAGLCGLLALAIGENWLAHLAYGEGRHDDAMRHSRQYDQYCRQIYSDTFSEEDRGKAWAVMD